MTSWWFRGKKRRLFITLMSKSEYRTQQKRQAKPINKFITPK